MDTALTHKFSFILDRNLAKANGKENHVCTSCDTVVLVTTLPEPWATQYSAASYLVDNVKSFVRKKKCNFPS